MLDSSELLHRVLSRRWVSMFETRCDKRDLKVCICNIERNATVLLVNRKGESTKSSVPIDGDEEEISSFGIGYMSVW